MSTKPHDPVFKVCIQCAQTKAVPVEREKEYRKAHAGQEFTFICADCATQDQIEAEITGGTVDDPLDTK